METGSARKSNYGGAGFVKEAPESYMSKDANKTFRKDLVDLLVSIRSHDKTPCYTYGGKDAELRFGGLPPAFSKWKTPTELVECFIMAYPELREECNAEINRRSRDRRKKQPM